MKDKLIELIKSRRDPCDIGACPFTVDDVRPCSLCEVESLAEHLIANGVTFADVSDNNVGKWIPVSERLPEKSGKYLVCYELWGWGKLFNRWTGLCFFYDEISQFIDDGGPVMGRITHWMPMPAPPKEGNNE